MNRCKCTYYAFSKQVFKNSVIFLSRWKECIFIWALQLSLTACCYDWSPLVAGLSLKFSGYIGCYDWSCPCSEHTLQSTASTNAFLSLLGAFAEFRRLIISFVMSSCLSIPLSVRIEQLGFHWTDFHEIWYLNILLQICLENSNFIKIWKE